MAITRDERLELQTLDWGAPDDMVWYATPVSNVGVYHVDTEEVA